MNVESVTSHDKVKALHHLYGVSESSVHSLSLKALDHHLSNFVFGKVDLAAGTHTQSFCHWQLCTLVFEEIHIYLYYLYRSAIH